MSSQHRSFHSRPALAPRIRQQLRLIVAAVVLTTILVVGYRAAHGQETLDGYKVARDAQQGKAITPVPLNMQGKNPDLVYLGSYLVNAQLGCNDCHTCPSFKGTDPYDSGDAGLGTPPNPGPVNADNYLAGGTPHSGHGKSKGKTFTAPNLTPDGTGMPGGMTYDDFRNGMQHGHVSRKAGHVLQVMPWPLYRNLYENDLNAIYQYLSAIPSAQPGTCAGPQETK